ncbi:hypothetical protein JVU11DRAFT_738 [Chiua virens]|nr:hypothetical protein JVU11DRAFT_738 [Chiua virens]
MTAIRVLCLVEHGRPAESSARGEHEDKLSKHLISVVVQLSTKSPTYVHELLDAIGPPISLKVLKSMKLNSFRLKVMKSFKFLHSRERASVQLWLKLHDSYVFWRTMGMT